jgi:cell filamentation protein
VTDPYLIPGTDTLRNTRGITEAQLLERWETRMSGVRLVQLEAGTVEIPGRWDLSHLNAFHRHLFGDVYPWAGEPRTVNISKGGSTFCLAQYIEPAAGDIFRDLARKGHLQGRDQEGFVIGAAELFAGLNQLHPYREGNGRTQRAFLASVGRQAGYDIDWRRADPEQNIAASIASIVGNDRPLAEMLTILVTRLDGPPSPPAGRAVRLRPPHLSTGQGGPLDEQHWRGHPPTPPTPPSPHPGL